MRVQLEVDEMHDAEGTAISLVPRGANTMPFKVIKGERTVLDFTKVFARKKDPAPTGVLAIVISKDADIDAEIAVAKSAGFKTDDPTEVDGATMFVQRDYDASAPGVGFVKLSDKVGVLCGFNPNTDSTSFDENLDQHGFIPGFDVAMAVLRETVFNALFNAEGADDAAGMISKAVQSFGSHVSDLAGALPVEAFKLDPLFRSAETVAKTDEPEAAEDEETAQAASEEAKPEQADPETPASEVAAEGDETETAVDEPEDAEPVVAEPEDDRTELVLKAIADLTAAVGDVTEQVKTLAGRVQKAEEDVEQASEIARKTAESIGGTVAVAAPTDKVNGKKTPSVPPLMDTGWDRVRKAAGAAR